MAANVPGKIKPAGVTPFIVRAVQLETAKPVIAYWCYYWVVQQILKRSLHNEDEECLQFTTTVMDKLEQMKTDQANNDAILDDVAGQAYVEQFAQETFDRALRPLKANKVTQQTASTFEAAATFFQLVNIWGQPDPETQDKIKYAKWNAARILKAIKEGKDPNESNPKQEEPKPEESAVPLDPNDPEVQLIGSGQPRPATVEDAPDDGGISRGPTSSYSLNAAAAVSAPNSPLPPTASVPDPVSPIAPPDVPVQEPGSYFPSAPSTTDQSPLELPSTTSMPPPGSTTHSVHSAHSALGSAPDIPSPGSHRLSQPPSVSHASPGVPSSPQDFYHPPPQHQHHSAPAPPFLPPQQHYTPAQAPSAPHNYHHGYSQPVIPKAAPAPPPPPVQQYGGNSQPTGPYNCDDMAMAQAQKHAKWAISALNFEDVPTAVRELQAALASLGAR
ncbi:Vta1 like-domain-containing protein [Xylaria bambusicola]|uniref:Vta1 like-domain-containing protein n=1 Tax=Xylaria bambusicola TaxID=326684 RepID=UPI002008931C|nr:Vta1 like-domain-containing protein [Xylaria bambusicola]KAI0509087.1 Vta1 like-domain-containing protein [Xylaria bambusicola]